MGGDESGELKFRPAQIANTTMLIGKLLKYLKLRSSWLYSRFFDMAADDESGEAFYCRILEQPNIPFFWVA